MPSCFVAMVRPGLKFDCVFDQRSSGTALMGVFLFSKDTESGEWNEDLRFFDVGDDRGQFCA